MPTMPPSSDARPPVPRKRLLPWLFLGLVAVPLIAGGIGYGIYQTGLTRSDHAVMVQTVTLGPRPGPDTSAADQNAVAVGQVMGLALTSMVKAQQRAQATAIQAVADTPGDDGDSDESIQQTSTGNSAMNIFGNNQNVSVVNGVVTINGVVQNGSQGSGTVGKGPVIDSVRPVAAFTKLKSSLAAHVTVLRGTTPSVTVKAQENVLTHILTEVNGNTLRLSAQGAFSVQQPVEIVVTTPDPLKSVTASGTGSINVGEISGDVTLDLSGTAQVTGHGNLDRVTADLSGTGALHLTGTASELKLDLSGTGRANLGDLRAANVTVDTSGVGAATVFASESVEIDASGVGSVTVRGNPSQRNVDRSGLAQVHYE